MPQSATVWLRDAPAYLMEAVDELPDDAELARPRKAHWGEMVPTVFLIDTMHEHDLYHAGEINKTRALLQGADKERLAMVRYSALAAAVLDQPSG